MAVLIRILACLDTEAISRATGNTLYTLSKELKAPYLWIVLDEAQIAPDRYSTAFYTEQSDKKTEDGHGRSVLREMVTNFNLIELPTRIIVAGTGLSLDSTAKDSTSTIGKTVGDFAVWNNTGGFNTQYSQSQYICDKLEGKVLSQQILDRAWHWLRGRYFPSFIRFQSMFSN
jgi:hypothetical protein